MKNIGDPFLLLSRPYQRQALLIIFLNLVQALLDVLSLAVVIPVFYVLFTEGRDILFLFVPASILYENWIIVLLLIVFLFAIKISLGILLARKQSDFLSVVTVALTEDRYRQFYGQSWENYLKDNSAEVARKIKTSPSDFAQYILQGHISLITDITSCALMFGVIVYYDFRVVAIIIILVMPVALIYFFYRRNILSGIDRSFRELTPLSNVILTQGIDTFAEARIYKKEGFFIERFMEIRKITSRQLASLYAAASVPSRLFEFTGIICFAGLVFYGRLSGVDHSGMMIVLSLLTVAMYRIIPSLNRILQTLSQVEAYGYSVSEIKNGFTVDGKRSTAEVKDSFVFKEKIVVSSLSFHYHDQRKIIDNVTFDVSKGEFVMIEGPSGVGKSTLLHILTGLLTHYEGEITIDGKILDSLTLPDFQRLIGFVPQSPTLFQDTLLKNITLSETPETDWKQFETACNFACLTSLIQSLPARHETIMGERGTNVSGGERQRINLARAIYRDADVFVLDESTSQLDHQTKENILNNLKILCSRGKTVILSSHDHLIKPYASKIIRLG